MSDTAPEAVTPDAAAPEAPAAKERSSPIKRFRRVMTPRLPADQLDRQGKIATAAWLAFGDSARAAAFLNTHDDALGGRPIALATESDAGYAQVAEAMTRAA